MSENRNQGIADTALHDAERHAAQSDGIAYLPEVVTQCARAIVYALRDVATAIRETNKEG